MAKKKKYEVRILGDAEAKEVFDSMKDSPQLAKAKARNDKIIISEMSKVKESDYQYSDDMSEISGFGDNYEKTCRLMVIRGLIWFDKNPKKKPEFQGYKNVYGIINETNNDAKELSKVITKGLDCTGAMHQACIGHILAIQKMGWENYCEDSRLRKLKE